MNHEPPARPLVSVLILTQRWPTTLWQLVRSLDTQDLDDIEGLILSNGQPPPPDASTLDDQRWQIFVSTDNLGVAGGRDYLTQRSSGSIILVLDDDADLPKPSSVNRIVQVFRANPHAGALALYVENGITGGPEYTHLPARRRGAARLLENSNAPVQCARFVGVGHALRREAYEEAGRYRDFTPYGHEEFDLALRLQDRDYCILYLNDVCVRHFSQPNRRRRLAGRWDIILAHRATVALYNLPWRHVCSTVVLWSIRTLWDTRGDVRWIFRALRRLWSARATIRSNRQVISHATRRRLRALRAPLYF